MGKTNRKGLLQYIKIKHDLAIGERTLDTLIKRINKAANIKLKVSGRSYKTGRKKTASITIKNILCNCLD